MPSSVSDAVGAAAAAAVQAIGITSGAPPVAVPVARRKTPSVPEGASQGLPQIVVSVSDEVDTVRLTAADKMRSIRFAVTVVTSAGQKAADDATVRQWRDQIEAAVYDAQKTAFGGITGFIEVRSFGGKVFDPAALAKDYNYSALGYEAKVHEPLAL